MLYELETGYTVDNILSEATGIINNMGVEVQTAVYSEKPPDKYVVIVPIEDEFAEFADNKPTLDKQSARIVILNKENPYRLRNNIVKALWNAGFSILTRKYSGFDAETKHHIMYVEIEGGYKVDL